MTNRDYAIRTGSWLLNNQIQEVQGLNPFSLDIGRFPVNVHIHTHKKVDGLLSTNWMTGMAVYALTMLYDLTKDRRWVESAEAAGNYLRCLQLTMDSNPEARGALVEYGHHYKSCSTRDSLSGAWGLLRLYRATEDQEFLDRAELFAVWYRNHAMDPEYGYPIWGHELGTGRPNKTILNGFQGGSTLFFRDLYEATGNKKYLETSLQIADFFMENFWDDENGIHITFVPQTGFKGDEQGAKKQGWNEMHKFNDDFAAIGLMLLGVTTGESRYLEWVDRYMQWCLQQQNDDGSFGTLRLSVSSCVTAMNLLNASLLLDKPEYLKGADRARAHLMSRYQKTPDDSLVDGGVLGLQHTTIPDDPDIISLRVTNYTVYALTLFGLIEEQQQGHSISEKLRNNPMFPGLRGRIT